MKLQSCFSRVISFFRLSASRVTRGLRVKWVTDFKITFCTQKYYVFSWLPCRDLFWLRFLCTNVKMHFLWENFNRFFPGPHGLGQDVPPRALRLREVQEANLRQQISNTRRKGLLRGRLQQAFRRPLFRLWATYRRGKCGVYHRNNCKEKSPLVKFTFDWMKTTYFGVFWLKFLCIW